MRRYLPIILTLLAGIAISLAGSYLIANEEHSQLKSEFERAASREAELLNRSLSSALEAVFDISSLFRAVDRVDRAMFASFVGREFVRHPGIQALEWIPRVVFEDRAAYEALARVEGYPLFEFRERQTQSQMTTAAARAEYFPVYFVEPYAGNELALGFDLASEPTRLMALQDARDTGEPVATGKITLVQEPGTQNGFIVFQPIYGTDNPTNVEERRRTLTGFTLGVFRIGDIVDAASRSFDGAADMEIFVFDQSAPDGDQLLYPLAADVGGRSELGRAYCLDSSIDVGGRNWLTAICTAPASVFAASYLSSSVVHKLGLPHLQSVLALVAGLLITGLLIVYLRTILARSAQIESVVVERTSELTAVNQRLRSAKRQAEQAGEAKARFLATMSHEIRTPLNGVLGVLGLLKESDLGQEQRDFVRAGYTSAKMLLEVIGDVLDFSKMDAGKLELERVDIEVSACLSVVEEMLRPRAIAKGIKFEMRLHYEAPLFITGDPGRMRQVLMNLVGNAIKFTNKGSVLVDVRVVDESPERVTLRIKVKDTGVGIPPDNQADLFAEFTTVDDSYARKYGGTGLGLAISKRLVNMMGGRIGMDSTPGVGSTFWFEIEMPKATGAEASTGNHFRKTPLAVGEAKSRILLVEDNPTNRMVTKAMVEKAGHQVDAVADGAEAVEAIRTLPYDVVLMDISMPDMDGLETTGVIRALPDEEMAAIPIIAMTAHAAPRDRENALAAGMDDYLAKPVTKDQLLGMIGRWAGHRLTSKPVDAERSDPTVLIDANILERLAIDTDSADVPSFVDSFLKTLELRRRKVAAARATKDLKVLEFEAHTLTSSGATFGAMRLTLLTSDIEAACRDGDADRALELAATLDDLAAKTSAALRKYLVKANGHPEGNKTDRA